MSYPQLVITFLGTGTSSGVPMIACPCEVCSSDNTKDKRLRSSILVRSKTTTLVVDTTPDFRYQMLRENVRELDAVVFTHPHKDHIAGLDDVRAYNYFSKKPMQVFANLLTQEGLRREFAYVFADKIYPGIPKIDLHTIDAEPFMVGDIPIIPVHVMHLKMPVLGFRFGDFTYITDANYINEVEMQKIIGSKVLVLNALRLEKHISHYTLSEVTELAEDLRIPQTYCTHISHQMGKHAEVNKSLPPSVQLAHDGLILEF